MDDGSLAEFLRKSPPGSPLLSPDESENPDPPEIKIVQVVGRILAVDDEASRNAGSVAAVSDLALIILAAPEASSAHDGKSPQCMSDGSRMGSLGFWRTTGMG